MIWRWQMILSALNSRFIILFSIFLVKVQINCLSQVVKCDLFLVQQTVAFSRRLQQLWNWKQNLQFILSLDFHSRPSLIVTDKAVTSVFYSLWINYSNGVVGSYDFSQNYRFGYMLPDFGTGKLITLVALKSPGRMRFLVRYKGKRVLN